MGLYDCWYVNDKMVESKKHVTLKSAIVLVSIFLHLYQKVFRNWWNT